MGKLHTAASRGDLAAVIELLNEGHDLTDLDAGGLSPLHEAACHGQTEVVRLLLDRGAEVDEPDLADGHTALVLAARYGQAGVVELLLARGANIDGCGGMSPLGAVEYLLYEEGVPREDIEALHQVEAVLIARGAATERSR